MKLSDKIRILRKARGLSQEGLGHSISETTDGVSRQTVSDWENGKFEPKLDNIRDIAKVLNVSFDVLLNESVDLNDATIVEKVLNNVSIDIKENINTKVRYSIQQYAIDKKHIARFCLWIAILCILAISVVFILVGDFSNRTGLAITGYVLGFISIVLLPTAIIQIRIFAHKYKNPYGHHIGEINNTHIIIKTFQTASNVIYLPIDKIKEIEAGGGAKKRCGNVVITLAGREKPITLLNVAFPNAMVDFYNRLLDANANDDPIVIL